MTIVNNPLDSVGVPAHEFDGVQYENEFDKIVAETLEQRQKNTGGPVPTDTKKEVVAEGDNGSAGGGDEESQETEEAAPDSSETPEETPEQTPEEIKEGTDSEGRGTDAEGLPVENDPDKGDSESGEPPSTPHEQEGYHTDEQTPDKEVPADSTEDLYDFNGRELSESEIKRSLELNDAVKTLGDNAYDTINAVASGEFYLVHKSLLDQNAQPPSAQAPEPALPAPAQHSFTDEELADLDPVIAQRLTAQEQQIAAMQQQTMADRDAANLRALNSGQESFQQRYNLPLDQVLQMRAQVAQSQVLPVLIAQHNGDVAAAMEQALDQTFRMRPEYEQTVIEQRVQEQLASEREAGKTRHQRKQKANALAGGGGSAPRRSPLPTTPAERQAAMAEEINAAMQG